MTHMVWTILYGLYDMNDFQDVILYTVSIVIYSPFTTQQYDQHDEGTKLTSWK